MSVESSYLIRHPRQIPLEIRVAPPKSDQSDSRSQQGCPPTLVFDCKRKIRVGSTIIVHIRCERGGGRVLGRVAWLIRSLHGYIIGMALYDEHEAFRMRMLEQVCHIEAYRQEAIEREGREMTNEEAAREWISSYAAHFPGPLPLAA